MKRLALFALAMVGPLFGQASPQSIQRLHASFISNFPAYVNWPGGNSQQISVGIIGPNPLGKAGSQYLKGHGFGGHQFVVIDPASMENLKSYQMLIVGDIDEKQMKQVLKRVAKSPVLTIGQNPKFLKMGGIINFRIQGNAVNFDVSTANAEKAGLKIDPRLITYGKTL